MKNTTSVSHPLALLILLLYVTVSGASVIETDTLKSDTTAIQALSQRKAEESLTDILPPSPTASGIIRYGDIPVSYSTGIPEISIPLYTIKCGSLEMPVTLSYHAGGIKVDEAASWVGLGWSLLAGGTVGGSVRRGASTEFYPITLPSFETLHNKDFPGFTWDDINTLKSMHIMPAPQWYSYSVNGISGKLVYDANDMALYDAGAKKEITFQKKNDVFSAIDNLGNSYLFDVVEMTDNTASSGSLYSTAWNLSRLKSSNGRDSINISYNRETSREAFMSHTPLTYNADQTNLNNWGGYYEFPAGGYAGVYGQFSSQRFCHIAYNMACIECSNGIRLKFIARNERKDYGSEIESQCAGAMLDEIQIYCGDDLVKRWRFSYGYFVSPTKQKGSPTYLRLKLAGIEEIGSDGGTNEKYSFEYYGDSPDEPQMPYRHAYAGKDIWGYCNGSPSQEDAEDIMKEFPNFKNFGFRAYRNNIHLSKASIRDTLLSYNRGSDRSANPQYAKTYSLKRIIYPTGGTTTFEYESNHFSTADTFSPLGDNESRRISDYGNGIRISRIISSGGGKDEIKSYAYSEGEIARMPQFIYRKTYVCMPVISTQYTPATNIFDGLNVTYLEFYPEPVNDYGQVNYPEVTETLDDGSNTRYCFLPLYSGYSSASDTEPIHSCFHSYSFSIDNGLLLFITGSGHFIYAEGREYPYEYTEIDSDKYETLNGFDATTFNLGMLLSKETRDRDGNLRLSEEYSYLFKDYKHIPGLDYKQYDGFGTLTTTTHEPLELVIKGDFSYNIYYRTIGRNLLLSKTTKLYDGDNSDEEEPEPYYTVTARYSYNDKDLPNCELVKANGNSIQTTTITYPTDYTAEPYRSMAGCGMWNYPIEKKTMKNGIVSSSELTTYKRTGMSYQPNMIAHSKIGKEDNCAYDGERSTLAGYVIDNIIEYGNDCRIKSIKDESDNETCYAWSRNGEHPIIEVRGIDAAAFETALEDVKKTCATDQAVADNLYNTFHNKYPVTALYYWRGELCYVILPDGTRQEFTYDGIGRLAEEKKETIQGIKNTVMRYDYNLKR